MKLTCRRQDVKRFEEIGFVEQEENTDGTVEMVDEEVNYAHNGEMPTDIPYHGNHTAGCAYPSEVYACDGKEYIEVSSNNENEAVVSYTETGPSAIQVKEVKRYFEILDRARQLLSKGE